MSPIFSRVGFNRGIGKPVKRTQRRLLKKYFQFTSPGTLDLASIPQVQSVDYFSITHLMVEQVVLVDRVGLLVSY